MRVFSAYVKNYNKEKCGDWFGFRLSRSFVENDANFELSFRNFLLHFGVTDETFECTKYSWDISQYLLINHSETTV